MCSIKAGKLFNLSELRVFKLTAPNYFMGKFSRRIAKPLTLFGWGVLVASFVFLFFFLAVLLRFQYVDSVNYLKIFLVDSCVQNKVANTTFDMQTCLQNTQQFLNTYPSYTQIIPQFFSGETLLIFLAPFIVGIVLAVLGFVLKKK